MSAQFAEYIGEPVPPERVIRRLGNEPIAAIAGTAAYTVAAVASSFYLLLLDTGTIAFSEELASATTWFVLLAGIAGYVTLCLWMQATRTRLFEVRDPAPPTWKVWWGWIIPIYSLVAPYYVMRDLRVRMVAPSAALLTTWWAAWLVAIATDLVYSLPIAVSTFTHALTVVGALATVTSFAALVLLIRTVSASIAPRT